jgi:hypothetical protein
MIGRGAVAALLSSLVISLFVGCSIGGPQVSASAKCDGPAFTSEDMPSAAPQVLVLVELSRNDGNARETVVQAIDPIVKRTVAEGAVVRLLAAGGEGRPILESPCLNGAAAIMVDRNNDETERRARNTAVAAIEGDVSAWLEEVKIGPDGDLSNLLAEAPGKLHSLASAEGTRPGAPASLLLISDLTSPAAQGDCLNLDGVPDTRRVADALVARCLETGQLRVLPEGTTLQIVKPQLTPGSDAGARMSVFLERSLCVQLTNESTGCVSGPVGEG